MMQRWNKTDRTTAAAFAEAASFCAERHIVILTGIAAAVSVLRFIPVLGVLELPVLLGGIVLLNTAPPEARAARVDRS